MKIAIKDNIVAEVEKGTTVGSVAKSISPTLAKNIICGKINGKLVDLDDSIGKNCKLELITIKDDEAFSILNDTTSHILAQAVKSVYPSAKLGSGGDDENGFYYDFEFKTNITNDNLQVIEEEMRQIADADFKITNSKMHIDDAISYMASIEEHYKIESLEKSESDDVGIYSQGEFIDFCNKPHIKTTSTIKYFKLIDVEPVYYKGSGGNRKLTRIKGIACFKAGELESKLRHISKINKRNHIKLGKEMELFLFEETNLGFPFWLPNGWAVYNSLLNYCRDINNQFGYLEVSSPVLSDNQLSIESGHYTYCTSDIFELKDKNLDSDYILKSANCPSAMAIYKSKERHESQLPLRYLEFGLLHRNLDETQLNGLFNVRSFRQDDAHIFTTPNQLESEFSKLFEICDKVYKTFGLKYSVELSTRPQNYVGDNAVWDCAEEILKSILDKRFGEEKYTINDGEGSFFGPRIDIVVKDSLARRWKTGSFQLDMQLPERVGLEYVDSDGKRKVPILIHRTILGSIERFIALLIEHFEGKFPFWISPMQTIIVTTMDENDIIIKKLKMALQSMGIRCRIEVGTFGEKLNKGLFKSEKVPYILSVDSSLVKKHKILVEVRGEKQIILEANLKDFLEKLNKLNKSRNINLIKEF